MVARDVHESAHELKFVINIGSFMVYEVIFMEEYWVQHFTHFGAVCEDLWRFINCVK